MLTDISLPIFFSLSKVIPSVDRTNRAERVKKLSFCRAPITKDPPLILATKAAADTPSIGTDIAARGLSGWTLR